jgi:hypothetical protein
VADPLP